MDKGNREQIENYLLELFLDAQAKFRRKQISRDEYVGRLQEFNNFVLNGVLPGVTHKSKSTSA